MFKTLILVGLLSSAILASQHKLSYSTVEHQEEAHSKHKSRATLKRSTIESTTDDSKPWLDDFQLTTPITVGAKTIQATVDTTSYKSWLLAVDPTKQGTERVCTGCPLNVNTYDCTTPNCTVVLDATTQPVKFTVNDITEAGRAQIAGFFATEKSVQLSNVNIKNVQIGLANTVTNPEKVIKQSGVLGLAYGRTFVNSEKDSTRQVNPAEKIPTLDPLQNFIGQAYRQNSQSLEGPQFSLKVEESLSLLSVGESQSYFADGPVTSYENVGQKLWALSLDLLRFGEADIVGLNTVDAEIDSEITTLPTTQPVATPPTPSAPGLPAKHEAVFDTTTRFLWVNKAVQDKFKAEIKAMISKDCTTAGANDVLACPCSSETDVKKFPELTFKFNGKSLRSKLAAEDYVQYKSEQCYVLVRQFKTEQETVNLANMGKDAIILPNSFFKQNFVSFDQKANTINIAKAFTVAPGPLAIEKNNHLATILVGLLLFFGALTYLVVVLKQVDYSGESHTTPIAVHPHSNPAPAPYNQPQFSTHLPPAPQYTGPTQSVYIQNPQSVQQVSPQRFAQSRPQGFPQTQSYGASPQGFPQPAQQYR